MCTDDQARGPFRDPFGTHPQGYLFAYLALVAVKPLGKNDHFSFSFLLFWVDLWPKLAPGPLSTGQASKMIQNAPKIKPVDQL